MLSAKEVTQIAHLARLGIEELHIESYAHDLNGVLNLMAQMNEVETHGIQPMSHPMDQVQRLRPDVITETNQRDYFQTIAPQVESGLYLVPKVLE